MKMYVYCRNIAITSERVAVNMKVRKCSEIGLTDISEEVQEQDPASD